jgi:peptidoglycan/xylan/chitin deacetylase (PgdA/CDA1 family)
MGIKLDLRVHLPAWITKMFPLAIWLLPSDQKVVYLTFDDGPIPEVTPAVLDILREKKVKATFFCVGENVYNNSEIFEQIKCEGHSVGNHTYNHLQGIHCSTNRYTENIELANQLIKSNMFRPPHGWLKQKQYLRIAKRYKIVMWDVISCDYDPSLKPEKCYKNVIDYTRNGSIITFHDSLKAKKNVLAILPKVIDELALQGYQFKKLEFPDLFPLTKHQKIKEKIRNTKNSITKLHKGA